MLLVVQNIRDRFYSTCEMRVFLGGISQNDPVLINEIVGTVLLGKKTVRHRQSPETRRSHWSSIGWSPQAVCQSFGFPMETTSIVRHHGSLECLENS